MNAVRLLVFNMCDQIKKSCPFLLGLIAGLLLSPAIVLPCLAAPGDFSGPYLSNGVSADLAGSWATSVIDSADQGDMDNILGAPDGSWAIGNPGGGFITVGFDNPITNGPGFDFAVWENGFFSTFIPPGTTNPHNGIYSELAFVDVSTNGFDWATFPSQYLEDMTPFPNVDPTYVNNLAGLYPANEGTPFDLDDILGVDAVLAGLVDPDRINFVRLRDIVGAGEGGSELDALGNLIYDGNGFGGGADWDAVGVINAVPVPGAVWLLASGLVGLVGIRRRGRC